METLFVYLIKTSVGIVVFYLVYWFFLRKETFYQANRWFLISSLLASLLIPLFTVHYSVMVESGNNQTVFKEITDAFRNAEIVEETNDFKDSGFNWTFTVFLVYLTGLTVFLLRLILQTAILFYLILKYKPNEFKGIRIVENEKYGLPFSFFNFIFINPKFHTQENLPEILAHENVHIREFHWFDLLFIELLTVIFWFNPFIWFFEQSIKQNHEYLADKGVLAQGHSVAKYQALLINQLMGMQIIGITNNLNFGLNTNRLKMMTKKKTPRLLRVKFTWALPAVALLLFAFAKPEYITIQPETIQPDISVQKEQKKFVIKGKVVEEETGKALPGAAIIVKGSTTGTISDMNGNFNLVDPNPKSGQSNGFYTEMIISFVGRETKSVTISSVDNKNEIEVPTIKLKEGVIQLDLTELLKQLPPPPPPPALKSTSSSSSKMETAPPPPPPPVSSTFDDEVFIVVEQLPEYSKGMGIFASDVLQMEKKFAKEKKVKGKATVGFTVSATGRVTNIKILEENNKEAGLAAVEIVKSMADWKPGSQRGKNVPVSYILPIEFK